MLAHAFDALAIDPALVTRDRDAPLTEIAGFLALKSPRAAALREALHARGVFTGARGDLLRLGPAPYLCDRQLSDAIAILGEASASLR